MLPFSFRFVRADVLQRPQDFDSGWRSFGDTLMTQVRGADYRVQTDDDDLLIKNGMGFLIPPGVRTRVSTPGSQTATVIFAHFHCRVYELQGLFTVIRRPIVFPRATGRLIGTCNKTLIDCQNNPRSLQGSAAANRCLAELVELAVAHCPELAEAWQRPECERLLPVLRFIQDHIDQPIRRPDLARVAGLSVPHLHTLFIRAFHCAPMDIVRRERLQHARQLLHWSQLPIAEVGCRCGFDDPYYFSRAFSKAEGVSPSRYRRERQAQGS